jgi:hypothetical protein
MLATIELPEELVRFQLPEAVQARLQYLLDKQDAGQILTAEERQEAEGLVKLAEFLSLLRPRSLRTVHLGQGDYLRWRDEYFAGQTVSQLFKAIQSNQEKQSL